MWRKLFITGSGILFYLFAFGQDNYVVLKEFIYEKAPFKSCHASTIAETQSGLVAAWFGGTHERHKDVEIWTSKKNDSGWTDPFSVANGITNNKRFPCWNPVLYYSKEHILYLFYKVGPSPTEWWGMLKKSYDDGISWSSGIRLPDGILGPIKNKPVLIEEDMLLCPSSTEHNGWKVQMEYFNLKNNNWEAPLSVNHNSVFSVIQPTILKHGDKRIQILCRSKEGFIISSISKDLGKTWSEYEATSLPNPNSGIDAVTLDNGKHILIYNHSEMPEGKWGGNRYPLNVAVSVDGRKWHTEIVLEDKEGEFSYPSVIQAKDGLIHVVYTWNRLKIRHVVIDPELIIEVEIH